MKNTNETITTICRRFSFPFPLLFRREQCSPPVEKSGISYSYTLSGVHSQELTTRVTKNIIGKMTITNLMNSTSEIVVWSVTLDKEAVTITSKMTYVLIPGSYRFHLEIVNGNQKYVGEAEQIISDADQLIIPLSVKPVIGDVNLNVTVSNMPKLTFNYPAEELAALTEPKIGYTIDGDSEIIVNLSKVNGTSDVYMDITEGVHTVTLKLYDGATQVGKSKVEQQSITVEANSDITMDIIPLHGEVQVTVPIDGGAGTFNLNIPAEVIAEAGGLENLKTTLQLSSPRNGSLEKDVVLALDNGNYIGSVSFDPIAYDTGVATITFIDIAKNELLATAVFSEVVLNETGASLTTSINLIRRAVISGNIQAVVGVNVFDEDGAPVLGAEVYVDDVLVGLTGSAWGTDGYLKFYHTSGEVTLRAESGILSGDSVLTFTTLGVENVTLIIDKEVHFIEVQSFPTSTMFDWESFEIEDESFVALANVRTSFSGNYRLNSPIYRWEGDSLVLLQNIQTSGATSLQYHKMNGEHFLFVSNYSNGSTRNVNSQLFKWNGLQFEFYQNVATSGAHDSDLFTIGEEHFLIVTNLYNGQSHNINSHVYKWDFVTAKFKFLQNIPTMHGYECVAFTINGEYFFTMMNHDRVTSSIFKWNGSKFEVHQVLPITLGIIVRHFNMNNKDYLALVQGDYYISLFEWKNNEFTELIHRIEGGSFDFVTKDNDHYLAVARAGHCAILKWNGAAFQDYHTIPSLSSADIEFMEYNNSVYLGVAHTSSGSDYTHNSPIYKWLK